jgi:serine/threonine-protein kinase
VARRAVEASPQPTTTEPTPTAPTTTAPVATTAPIEPEPASVPEVVGRELADAARAFGDEGLKISVQYVPNREPQGRVVAQAQPAGTQREQGDTVQVNVSIGPEPAARASVPGVTGRSNEEARRSLESAGFEVLALNLQTNRVRREDRVSSQSPSAGASIPRGSLVLLYLAAA